jgi:hypothetical protein
MSGWVRYLALTATVKTGLSLQVFVWGPLPLTWIAQRYGTDL